MASGSLCGAGYGLLIQPVKGFGVAGQLDQARRLGQVVDRQLGIDVSQVILDGANRAAIGTDRRGDLDERLPLGPQPQHLDLARGQRSELRRSDRSLVHPSLLGTRRACYRGA